jgi:hypothetical protein
MIRKLILSLLLTVPVSSAFAANSWVVSADCGCALVTPLPDQGTANKLDAYGVPGAPFYIGTIAYSPGDTITICNNVSCAQYTRTTDKKYANGQASNQTPHPPKIPGGGGGGGSGSGGGGFAGGGSGIGDPTPPDGDGCPGCNPTVTVGAG